MSSQNEDLRETRGELARKIALAKRFGCRLVEIGRALSADWGIPDSLLQRLDEGTIQQELKDMLEGDLGAGSMFSKLLSDIGHLKMREAFLVRKVQKKANCLRASKPSD